MIYVSISAIPPRIKNLEKSVESILKQTLKPDKIFINIPFKYRRFPEIVSDSDIPKFNNNPNDIITDNIAVPPYDIRGKGMPTIGINPETIAVFRTT